MNDQQKNNERTNNIPLTLHRKITKGHNFVCLLFFVSEYFCFSWFCVSTDNVFQKIRGTNYQEFLFGDGIQVTIVFKGLNSYDDVLILVVFVTHILIKHIFIY
jgi:hypothetical protein